MPKAISDYRNIFLPPFKKKLEIFTYKKETGNNKNTRTL